MATWDVFHSDRLEVERGLSTAEVRAAIDRGGLGDDDLIRPSGAPAPWTRIADMPPLAVAEVEAEPEAEAEPEGPSSLYDIRAEREFAIIDDDFEDAGELPSDSEVRSAPGGPFGALDVGFRQQEDHPSESLEIVAWDDDLDPEDDDYDPQEEDEAAAEFTLSRGSTEKVEELDLAAMVDVAFQLVLFFLVTATTVLYKSLEVPKPNPENAPNAAATQGRSKTLDELKDDFILVEIDPAGAVKIDREPVRAEMSALVERLRSAREQTKRKSMLLSADFATPHRSAVLAYDAANEIGLLIAIARPSQNPVQPPPGK